MQSAENIINKEKYPLHQAGTDAWITLTENCKASFQQTGAVILKSFVQQAILDKMIAETDNTIHKSHFCKDNHNVFFEDDDGTLPADHPLRMRDDTSLNSIPHDMMNSQDALNLLYTWEPLISFLSEVLGYKLFRMADPMAALTVNCMGEGQNHGWHYDESQVTITLLIQKPNMGGLFQSVPDLRKKDTDDYSRLGAVLKGSNSGVVTLDVEPGDLLIFAGFYSLHRVTPIQGDTTRYVGTLCYKDKPNVMNSPEVQKLFYGRVNQG